jgi:hypothetical protein
MGLGDLEAGLATLFRHEKRDLEKFLIKVSKDKKEADFWLRKFTAIQNGGRNGIWDYQWNFTIWYMNSLAVVPNYNLISNIGFREDATGTTNAENKFANLPHTSINYISFPKEIEQNEQADFYAFYKSQYYFHPTFGDKIRWNLKSLLSKSTKTIFRSEL